jgi:hypothetical protein
MPSTRRLTLPALAFIFLFVIGGIWTLPQYGLTWDEGLGNLFFGQRYLWYVLTWDSKYLDFGASDLAIHQRALNLYESPFRNAPHEFPALADTVSAGVMETLGRSSLCDPIDAFHLAKVLLSGVLLWVLFQFTRRRLGPMAALFAIVLLGSYPRFWGDMHFNPKDIPECAFFSFTVMAFVRWLEKPSWRRALAVGCLFGCSLAIKANALFLPVVFLVGVLPWPFLKAPWEALRIRLVHLWQCLAILAIVPVVFFLSWPYLYAAPSRFIEYFRYIASQGQRSSAGWNKDALVQTIATMPEIMLILLPVGLVFAVWHHRSTANPLFRMLIAWAVVPVLRSSLPGAVNFDGIRHFEEFLPAACVLAGYGAASLVAWLTRLWPKRGWVAAPALGILIAANIGTILVRFAPYEYLYFNSLVGGLSGANRSWGFSEATDYWGASYRNGIRWLNAHAEPDAVLHVPIAEWLVRIPAPLWLRRDIRSIPREAIASESASGRPVYIMFVTRAGWYDEVAKRCVERLKPVHEIVVDGLPILLIYRAP